jgi:excisionase family DNA binding protein
VFYDRYRRRSSKGRALLPATSSFDQLLGRLADLVAERVAARIGASGGEEDDRWLDTRGAAEYLGVHRDTIRRLASERAIPAEQAGAGCKLYFRRHDLDQWRRAAEASASVAALGQRR